MSDVFFVRASLDAAADRPACFTFPENVVLINRHRVDTISKISVRGTFSSNIGITLVIRAKTGLTNSLNLVR